MSILSFENKQLLSLIKKDDSKAYAKIYTAFYSDLCKYLANFTNNKSLAEDIVQDVLLKLWVKRKELDIHTSLKSYLYRATYFGFLDHYRKNKRINENLELLRYNFLNEIIEEDLQITEHRLFKLKDSIEKLPDRCKQIFLLSKFEGYRYREIADYLNLSVKTVENQIGKAYKILRNALLIFVFLLR